MDRLSTGSKESNMSTQSDWIGGEKKKKSGLIGECVFFETADTFSVFL